VLGSPTEQTPVFAVVMRGPSSASPATAAAATSVLVLARLRRRFTRLDHTRRPRPGPSLAVWYVANVVTHHGAAAAGMLGPRRLRSPAWWAWSQEYAEHIRRRQTDGRCLKWRPSDDAQYVFLCTGDGGGGHHRAIHVGHRDLHTICPKLWALRVSTESSPSTPIWSTATSPLGSAAKRRMRERSLPAGAFPHACPTS
jgi:hypothetical protein